MLCTDEQTSAVWTVEEISDESVTKYFYQKKNAMNVSRARNKHSETTEMDRPDERERRVTWITRGHLIGSSIID